MICALPAVLFYLFNLSTVLAWQEWSVAPERSRLSRSLALEKRGSINYNPDGSPFLWLPQDEYSGRTFFEYVHSFHESTGLIRNFCSSRWTFFNYSDPT